MGESSGFDQELTSIGERVERNEYPFVAALYMEEKRKIGHRTFPLRSSDPFCSGVLISRRHVMTAAHCFMENEGLGPKNVVITAGSRCADPGQCVNDKKLKSHEIDRVIIHPNYTSNPISNDVAIVVLGEDVSKGEAEPICMPTRHQEVLVPLVAAGFGLDENMDFPGLQMVRFSRYTEESGYIETMSASQSVCKGDSGGPLFQLNDEQKLVLMGITSAVRPDCIINSSLRRNYFMDVRKYLKWICDETDNLAELKNQQKYSGVCPVNAEGEQQTTTTPSPGPSTATSTHGIGLLVSVLVLLNVDDNKSFAHQLAQKLENMKREIEMN
ncbi:trypsin [Ancylostoma duodenale]|uniref:Trypsin n=1 Tax=Ancylostoma duodenale TaxID=51022 RepID=A0A0C2CZ26_9BILA|nr:trypsin [Ancylostoma duodenale]